MVAVAKGRFHNTMFKFMFALMYEFFLNIGRFTDFQNLKFASVSDVSVLNHKIFTFFLLFFTNFNFY